VVRHSKGAGVTGKCHQMPHWGGREFTKVSRDNLPKILNQIFIYLPSFSIEIGCFGGNQNVTSQQGGPGGGGVSPNDTWGGESIK